VIRNHFLVHLKLTHSVGIPDWAQKIMQVHPLHPIKGSSVAIQWWVVSGCSCKKLVSYIILVYRGIAIGCSLSEVLYTEVGVVNTWIASVCFYQSVHHAT